MPWQPEFVSIFESLILDNILKMFKDRMKLALDFYYPSENLPDFAQITLGNVIQISQPTLAVEASRAGADNLAEYEGSQLKIFIYMTVDDAHPDEAARKLEKYIRAAKGVLNVPATDYTAGMTGHKAFGLTKDLSWDYNQVAKDVNVAKYLKSVTFDLTLKYSER